jgi:osmoprotectant transport system permease protein
MTYLFRNFDEVAVRFGEHLRMTLIALLIAFAIALPVGILVTRVRWLQGPVLGVLQVMYTVPSLALLILLIPFVGLGLDNAVIVLVVYAQVILVRNIVVGLNGVDRSTVEAARGMGMNAWQQLTRVELPLALPVILAGIRIAAVTLIGIGALAALINAGGLGRLLFDGVTQNNPQKIIAGSLAAALLAGIANGLLRILERRSTRRIYGDET